MSVRGNVHKKNFVHLDKTKGVLWISLHTRRKPRVINRNRYNRHNTPHSPIPINSTYPAHYTNHTIRIQPRPRILRKNIFWCISSFRPDLLPYMVSGKKYTLDNITFDTQNLSNGEKIRIPNKITVGGKTFQNVV